MAWFNYLKVFLLGFIAFIIIDLIWLSVLMGDFYKTQLGSLARRSGDSLAPNIPTALMTWALLVIGIMVFVLPLAGGAWWKSILFGAFFGFVVYGVYDLTNYAVLKDFPLVMVVIDIAWGSTVCGLCSLLLSKLTKWFL